MINPPTAPQSGGGTLQHTLRLYRAAVRGCLPLSLLGTAALLGIGRLAPPAPPDPVLAALDSLDAGNSLDSLQSLDSGSLPDAHQLLAGYVSAAALRVDVMLALVFIVFCCALTLQVHAATAGERVSTRAALLGALRTLPAALAAGAFWLLVSGASLLLLAAPSLSAPLLLLIVLLLFLGGYGSVRWQLWLPALYVEHVGAVAALRHSWQVTRGHWWRAASALTLVSLVIWLLSVLVDTLAQSLAAPMHGAGASALPLVAGALTWIGDGLLLPLVPAALLAIYLDLRASSARTLRDE